MAFGLHEATWRILREAGSTTEPCPKHLEPYESSTELVQWVCVLLSHLLSVRTKASPAHQDGPAHQASKLLTTTALYPNLPLPASPLSSGSFRSEGLPKPQPELCHRLRQGASDHLLRWNLGGGSHLPGGLTAGISGFSNDPACPSISQKPCFH